MVVDERMKYWFCDHMRSHCALEVFGTESADFAFCTDLLSVIMLFGPAQNTV